MNVGTALNKPQQRLWETRHVIQQTFLSWESQMGRRTDRKHTHVGLISRSGWSDRSSPSGLTQCPFRCSSVPWDEENFVVWQRGCVRRSLLQRWASGIHKVWLLLQRDALVATLTWEIRGIEGMKLALKLLTNNTLRLYISVQACSDSSHSMYYKWGQRTINQYISNHHPFLLSVL